MAMKGYPVYKGDPPPKPEQDEYMDGVGLELLDQAPLKDRYAEGIRRDNICKRLSEADGDELMARYGYVKVGRTWVQQRDR